MVGARRDFLRLVYQRFLDPVSRRTLGEFYTTEELVKETLDSVGYDGRLDRRVMDISCGSGTFLVEAISRAIATNPQVGAAELAQRITEGVIGVDIHPFAVAMARVNYLIAISSLLETSESVSVTVPVYWADSLAAVKKLVYEEKKLSMAELIRAIDADFIGYENIQQMLINDAPKYGNDIDYVDELAREIFQFASAEVRKYIGVFGNRNVSATHVSTAHIIFGTFVWATPDGRKAGERFSDNVGPTDQRDREGPIAHINSVTKLGLERQVGTIHNMYLTNVDSDDKKHKMIDLIDAYHSKGGHHLQINCIDKDILIDAQKHPEKYPALMVRVAGYVAYFVDLSKMVQDGIIARTSVKL